MTKKKGHNGPKKPTTKPAFDPAYPKHTPPKHGHNEDEDNDDDPGKDDPWNKPAPGPVVKPDDDSGGNPNIPPPNPGKP